MDTSSIVAIICALISAASGVVVAFIGSQAERGRKRSEARAERRTKESRLSMDLMSATCELSVVTAVAMREGHTNGTLQPALQKAQIAQDNYKSFLRDEAARAVAKV